MRGYTGATDWIEPRFILQFDTPNEYNLARLEGMTAHEMQHLLRFQVQPFSPITTKVADFIVAEGTAESFAQSLYGAQILGYYVTDFDEIEIETTRRIIGKNLDRAGLSDIRSFTFGDHWARSLGLPEFGVPDYGGYAIGYRVVQEYLRRTRTTIEEPTFLPATKICRESGFVD